MKFNRKFLSLLFIMSSSFIGIVAAPQNGSVSQKAEACECKISVTNLFGFATRKIYKEEHADILKAYDADLIIEAAPDCLPKEFWNSLLKFAKMRFVGDDGKVLTPERVKNSQEWCVRFSLAKIYRDKRSFLADLSVEDIKAGKYNDSDALEKKFQDSRKKMENKK